jgi:hypothetical protein
VWGFSRPTVKPRVLARVLTARRRLCPRAAAPRAHTLPRRPCTRLLAAGGADAEANHRGWREERGLERLIPPVAGRPARGLPRPPSRRPRPRACPRNADGQRGPVATCIAVVTRRCGGAVTARRDGPQMKQPLRRGVPANLYRAVPWGLSAPQLSPRPFTAAA